MPLLATELLLGRRFRSRLDFLRPNTADKVEEQLEKQKRAHDEKSGFRQFSDGLRVWVKNTLAGDKN